MSDLPEEKKPAQRGARQGGDSDETVPTKAPELRTAKLLRIISELPSSSGAPLIFNMVGGKQLPTAFAPRLVSNVYRADKHIIFDTQTEVFHTYDPSNGLFTPKSHDDIREELATLTFELGVALSEGADETEAAIIANVANKATTSGALNGHMAALKSSTSGNFDGENVGVVHCLSGFIDIKTGANRGRSPQYKSRNMAPFVYRKDAGCPRFLNELLAPALPDQGDIDLLQMMVGQMILGENRSQNILLLYGTAGSGKGVIVSIIQMLVGVNNWMQLRTKHLGGRFEKYPLLNKTLLVGVDVPSDFLAQPDAGELKSLTGGDGMFAEAKNRRQPIKLRGDYNVVITCNAQPKLKPDGDAGAWDRRIIPICFDQPKVKNIIRDYDKKLMGWEGGGIAGWGFEGLKKADDLGYRMTRTKAQNDRMRDIIDSSRSAEVFAEHHLVKCAGGNVSVDELLGAYAYFCNNQRWDRGSDKDARGVISAQIMSRFGIGPSKSIKRRERGGQSKEVKGYRGVSLSASIVQHMREAA